MPTLRGLCILIFSFLFSFFSAQDSLQTKISQKTNISVIGKAQIYSSDEFFNNQITTNRITVNAKINPYKFRKEKILVLLSVAKVKNFSKEIKLTQNLGREKINKEINAKIEKAARNSTIEQIRFQHSSSQEFSYAGNSSKNGMLVPVAQNNQLKGVICDEPDQLYIFSCNSKSEKSEYNSTSKTSYFFSTNSVRPPPVSIFLS